MLLWQTGCTTSPTTESDSPAISADYQALLEGSDALRETYSTEGLDAALASISHHELYQEIFDHIQGESLGNQVESIQRAYAAGTLDLNALLEGRSFTTDPEILNAVNDLAALISDEVNAPLSAARIGSPTENQIGGQQSALGWIPAIIILVVIVVVVAPTAYVVTCGIVCRYVCSPNPVRSCSIGSVSSTVSEQHAITNAAATGMCDPVCAVPPSPTDSGPPRSSVDAGM